MVGPFVTMLGAVAALVLVILGLPWEAVLVLCLVVLWLLSGVVQLRRYVERLEEPFVLVIEFEDEPEEPQS